MTFKFTGPSAHRDDYRRVLDVSLPLVAGMASTTVMEFTDRIFVGNHSVAEVAAATPAGIAYFLPLSLFLGTVGYVSVFISQYRGAGMEGRIGSCLWQGLWLSLLAAVVMLGYSFCARPLFDLAGHGETIAAYERIYFRTLCLGAFFSLASSALSGYFSGMGRTRPVMVVNIIGMVVNIPLDYALINGIGPFPELGIFGAGLATVSASALIFILFAGLVLAREGGQGLGLTRWVPVPSLMKKVLHYGLPGGLHLFLDIFAFTFFVFLVGRLGETALAATNIALSINSLAFMPLYAFSSGTSVLVGNHLGGGELKKAESVTFASLHLALVYVLPLCALFLFAPEPLINLFAPAGGSPEAFAPVREAGVVCLRFVVVYLFFDTVGFVASGALSGAGDTRYIMWATLICAFTLMILPAGTGVLALGLGLTFAWCCPTVYIAGLCLATVARYINGPWRSMRLVETDTPPATKV
ncbi:MATE family efflux transporter [Desulfoluna butyratoxydans]|uniref:Multidrug-efflux transporter n=1 Tax=Desulfoluna butyratoxydans TaxID=231438 RepID=A0A4U8YJV7_9BACT|nr:MATE family efflux transporter [Desulfoluna butyratoxydans]VFQ43730.1 multi antimicrobial extrusion protein [Desulfoluna butyratoxydans]